MEVLFILYDLYLNKLISNCLQSNISCKKIYCYNELLSQLDSNNQKDKGKMRNIKNLKNIFLKMFIL